MGIPNSAYIPILQLLLRRQVEGGHTDYGYAKILGVNQSTIWRAREQGSIGSNLAYKFIAAYPEFAENLSRIIDAYQDREKVE